MFRQAKFVIQALILIKSLTVNANPICAELFPLKLPKLGKADLIILNLNHEGTGLAGHTVDIDFKDGSSFRNIFIVSVEKNSVETAGGLYRDELTIIYSRDGQSFKILPEKINQIEKVGIRLESDFSNRNYDKDTRDWEEFKMGENFAAPELPDGTMLNYKAVLGKEVSLLIYPEVTKGEARAESATIVTGILTGWPRYQQNYSYNIKDKNGKEIEVQAHSVRRFKVHNSNKKYDKNTMGWVEFKMGENFAAPELPDGTILNYNAVLGKEVSLLLYPEVANGKTRNQIVTGILTGWPIYQQNYTYSVKDKNGKEIEVQAHSVRRFKAKTVRRVN